MGASASTRPSDHLSEGVKFDTSKPTFELLPDDALAAIQKVLDFGAHKYAARNWEKGMGWGRVWNACLRHLWAWMRRDHADPESGMSHLWHAGCCILFLIAYEIRRVGQDDRPPSLDPVVGFCELCEGPMDAGCTSQGCPSHSRASAPD